MDNAREDNRKFALFLNQRYSQFNICTCDWEINIQVVPLKRTNLKYSNIITIKKKHLNKYHRILSKLTFD